MRTKFRQQLDYFYEIQPDYLSCLPAIRFQFITVSVPLSNGRFLSYHQVAHWHNLLQRSLTGTGSNPLMGNQFVELATNAVAKALIRVWTFELWNCRRVLLSWYRCDLNIWTPDAFITDLPQADLVHFIYLFIHLFYTHCLINGSILLTGLLNPWVFINEFIFFICVQRHIRVSRIGVTGQCMEETQSRPKVSGTPFLVMPERKNLVFDRMTKSIGFWVWLAS